MKLSIMFLWEREREREREGEGLLDRDSREISD
jgi:hypothetical protein